MFLTHTFGRNRQESEAEREAMRAWPTRRAASRSLSRAGMGVRRLKLACWGRWGPRGGLGTAGRAALANMRWVGVNRADSNSPLAGALPPPPACLLGGPSGFHQVSQQSGCDIMRQAGVSGVTSCGPDVWKSPNQNDLTDRLETELPKRPLQLPKDALASPFLKDHRGAGSGSQAEGPGRGGQLGQLR